MENIRDTPELMEWFNKCKEELKITYNKRIQQSINMSSMIQKSIAYHTTNEQAIKDGYWLTECQINKIIPLITL